MPGVRQIGVIERILRLCLFVCALKPIMGVKQAVDEALLRKETEILYEVGLLIVTLVYEKGSAEAAPAL